MCHRTTLTSTHPTPRASLTTAEAAAEAANQRAAEALSRLSDRRTPPRDLSSHDSSSEDLPLEGEGRAEGEMDVMEGKVGWARMGFVWDGLGLCYSYATFCLCAPYSVVTDVFYNTCHGRQVHDSRYVNIIHVSLIVSMMPHN